MGFAAAIPGIIGILGSLFGGKGKKTQYASMQTPEMQQAYSALLKMVQGNMGQQSAGYQPTSDALNMLYGTYFGQPGPQQPTATKPNYYQSWLGNSGYGNRGGRVGPR